MDERDERRHAERHEAFVGAELELEGMQGRWTAMTKDLSATGLLLFCRGHLKLEQPLTLFLFLPGDGPPLEVRGKVVRRKELSAEESTLWSEKVAVAFDALPADVAETFEALSREQAHTLGRHS